MKFEDIESATAVKKPKKITFESISPEPSDKVTFDSIPAQLPPDYETTPMSFFDKPKRTVPTMEEISYGRWYPAAQTAKESEPEKPREIPDWVKQRYAPEQIAEWQGKGVIGAGESFHQIDPMEVIPTMGQYGAYKQTSLREAVDRLTENKYDYYYDWGVNPMNGAPMRIYKQITDEKERKWLRQGDAKLVQDYLDTQAEETVRGRTIGGKIVQGATPLPDFILSMLATGGTAGGVKAAIQGGISGLGGKLAGSVGSAVTRTAMTGYATGNISQRMTPKDMEFKGGRLQINQPGEGLGTAAWKGVGDAVIEFFSEESGTAIGKIGKKLLPKPIREAVEKFGTTAAGKASKAISEKVGTQGLLEEWGEERLGGFLRAVSGIEGSGTLFERIKQSIPNGEQTLVELGVLGIPQAGRLGIMGLSNQLQQKGVSNVPEVQTPQTKEVIPSKTAQDAPQSTIAPVKPSGTDIDQILAVKAAEATGKSLDDQIRTRAEQRTDVPKTSNEFLDIIRQDTLGTGGLARGLDYYTGLAKGLSNKDLIESLRKIYQDGSEFLKRFTGGDIASVLRSRGVPVDEIKWQMENITPAASTPGPTATAVSRPADAGNVAPAVMEGGGVATWGSTNKLITSEQAEEARKTLYGGETTLYSGLPVEHIKAMTTLGLFHAEAGARKFADWSARMVEDMGDRIKPYLPVIWDHIRQGGQVNLGPEAFPKDVEIGKWKGLAIDPSVKLTNNNRKAYIQKTKKEILADPFYKEIEEQVIPIVNPVPGAGKVLVSDAEYKGEILSQNPDLRKYFVSESQWRKQNPAGGMKPIGWDTMLVQMADADPRIKADQSINYYIDQLRSFLEKTKKTGGVNQAALEEARQHPYINMLARKLEMLQQGKSKEEINQSIQEDIEYYGIGEYGELQAKTGQPDIVLRTGREKRMAAAYEKKMAALNAELTRAKQGQPAKQPTVKQRINQITGVTSTEPPIVTGADALEYAMKHEAKGSMTGYRSGLLEKKATQKEIIEFMETHLPESERGKFMRAVSNLEPGKAAHRERLIEAVNLMQDKYERRKAVQEYNKVKKRIIEDWNKIKGFYQQKISALAGGLTGRKLMPATEERLRAIIESHQKNPDSVPYRQALGAKLRLEEADALALNKLPADSIRQITETIKAYYEDAMIINKIEAMAAAQKVIDDKATVIKELENHKPIESWSEAGGFDPKMGRLQAAWIGSLGANERAKMQVGERFHELMIQAPQNGQSQVYEENRITENRLASELEKHGLHWKDIEGKKKSAFFANNAKYDWSKVRGWRRIMGTWTAIEKAVGLRTEVESVIIDLPSQGKHTFNSWAEVMCIYAHLSIPENRDAVLKSGLARQYRPSGPVLKITSADAQAITNALPGPLKAVADFIVKEMGSRGKSMINRASDLLAGKVIATIEYYFPLRRSMIEKVQNLSELIREWRTTLENLGFLKPREGSRLPILYSDIFELYFDHMNQVAQYSHLAPPLRDAFSVLSDDVLKKMNNTLGTQEAQYWLKHLDAPIQRYRSSEIGGPIIQEIFDKGVKSRLRLGIFSGLKNITGLVVAWPRVGTKYMLAGLANLNKNTVQEMLDTSADMWHRYHLGAMEMVSPSFDVKLLHEGKLDTTMSPLWQADRYVAAVLWEALKAKGLSGQALARAHRDLINKTQNPTDTLNMTEVALDSNRSVAWKGLTLFMTDATRQLSLLRESYHEIAQGKNIKQNIEQMAAITIVSTILIMGIDELRLWIYRGFKERDKKYRKTKMDYTVDFLMNQLNRLYLVGDLAQGFRAAAKNQYGKTQHESIPEQLFSDAMTAYANLMSMIEHIPNNPRYGKGPNAGKKKWHIEGKRFGKAMISFIASLTGFPMTPIRIVEGIEKSQEDR